MSLKTWDGTQWIDTAAAHIHDTYLQLIGGTMTGDITLAGDPTQPLHPATKQYVDGIQDGLHTIATEAPAGPNIGDVWVNPDAVDENAYLPLNGTVAMTGTLQDGGFGIDLDGSLNFPRFAGFESSIGLEADNQGVSLNLGDRVSGLSPIPFIDFYGGTSVIAARIILRDQETGSSRSGGLKYEASQGHLFVGNVTVNTGYKFIFASGTPVEAQVGDGSGAGFWMNSSNDIRIVDNAGGSFFRVTSNRFYCYSSLNDTGATTPNVDMLSDGRLRRVGSARAGKAYIKYPKLLHQMPLPAPAEFEVKAENADDTMGDHVKHLGFIAEDLENIDPRLGRFTLEGKLENYDDRGLMAMMVAHILELEKVVFG